MRISISLLAGAGYRNLYLAILTGMGAFGTVLKIVASSTKNRFAAIVQNSRAV